MSGIGMELPARGADLTTLAAGAAEGRPAGWQGCSIGGKDSGRVIGGGGAAMRVRRSSRLWTRWECRLLTPFTRLQGSRWPNCTYATSRSWHEIISPFCRRTRAQGAPEWAHRLRTHRHSSGVCPCSAASNAANSEVNHEILSTRGLGSAGLQLTSSQFAPPGQSASIVTAFSRFGSASSLQIALCLPSSSRTRTREEWSRGGWCQGSRGCHIAC